MKTNPNEPIYPDPSFGNIGAIGLTKREYFAAMFMQGLSANPNNYADQEKTADWAVKSANALIKALNNEQNKG